MNKLKKYISLSCVSMLVAGMAVSCDYAKNNDFVQMYDGEPGVYFSTDADPYLELDPEKSAITYYAYRDEAGPEQTILMYADPMDYYDVPDIFTFPDEVTFPEGSKVAEIVIEYDIAKTTLGEEQQYLLTLDAEPNPFASNQIVITLVNPAPWKLLGTNGQYFDYFGVGIDGEGTPGPAIVSVYQREDKPNYFRITNPYYDLNGNKNAYFQFQILEVGQDYLWSTVTTPNLVGFNNFELGFVSAFGGETELLFVGYLDGFQDTSNWTANTVVEYQDNGLPGLITLSPVFYIPASGSAYGDPYNPFVYIYFPGYESKDTSLELSYEGTIIDASLKESVMINVTMGADITSARAAVSGDLDVNQLIQAIETGAINYTVINESGTVKIPFEDNETGNYTVAVVAYNNENVKNTASASFFYVASGSDFNPNEGWKSLGTVNYTDGYIVSGLFTGTSTIRYRVEIQESETRSRLYRLVNPYGTNFASFFANNPNPPVSSDYPPSYIIIDATITSRVKVLQSTQPIVFNPGTSDAYGLMNTWSWASMLEQTGESPTDIAAQGLYGSYTNGQITFPPFTLYALWSDEPDTWYSANYALDYDKMGQNDPIYTNPDGSVFAPFCVDMNSLQPAETSMAANPVGLPLKSTFIPRSAFKLNERNMPKILKKGKNQFIPLEMRKLEGVSIMKK